MAQIRTGASVANIGMLRFLSSPGMGIVLLLIWPIWAQKPGAWDKAAAKARKLVGMPYDFLETVALDPTHSYYCSESAIKVYGDFITKDDKLPKLMEPGQMYLLGAVSYDSRPGKAEGD